jgi:predicted lipoprotein with Yx(FWY)xxD motif
MRSDIRSRRPRRLTVALSVLAAAALVAGPSVSGAIAGASSPHAAAAAAKKPKPLRIHTARNATLGKTILVTGRGLTLYTLSKETHGHFICTRSCLTAWKPLKLARGQKATGVAKLGVVVRPGGVRQATFNGRPLYTFIAGDKVKGDVNGEGIKDVGIWHAAVAPKAKKTQPKPPAPAPDPVPPTPAY